MNNIVILNALNFSGVRNWFKKNYTLQFSEHFNFFIGKNGAGKTALLETIYILSTGQSFKTRHLQELISFSKDALWVSGELLKIEDNQEKINHLGVQRRIKNKPIFRFNEMPETSLKKFSQILPIQCLYSECYNFFHLGSANRRKFIDWYLFHVEHSLFYQDWLIYKNLLKQRNFLLKNKNNDLNYLNILNKRLSISGSLINNLRKIYIQNIENELNNNLELKDLYQNIIPEGSDFKIIFTAGWNETESLEVVLNKNLIRDQKLGFTQYGPHRADLEFRIDNKAIENVLSRGQLKLFVFGLYFAREFMLKKFKKTSSIFIVDDLKSDLDQRAVFKILKILKTMGNQNFISFCEESEMENFLQEKQSESKMFHVEQLVSN